MYIHLMIVFSPLHMCVKLSHNNCFPVCTNAAGQDKGTKHQTSTIHVCIDCLLRVYHYQVEIDWSNN